MRSRLHISGLAELVCAFVGLDLVEEALEGSQMAFGEGAPDRYIHFSVLAVAHVLALDYCWLLCRKFWAPVGVRKLSTQEPAG